MGPQTSGYSAGPTEATIEPGRRPGTLTAALVAMWAAALSAFAFLAVTLIGGREAMRPMLEQILRDEAGDDAALVKSLGGSLLEAALDQAYATLTMRGYIIASIGLVVAVCALLVAGGRGWARVVFVIFAGIGLLVWLGDIVDSTPTTQHVLDAVALIAAIVAIVTIWLGPSNRYMKARKLGRAA